MEHPQAGVDYPRNWHELLAWFPDDAACQRFLERLRWGDGFACRFCGVIDADWWAARRRPPTLLNVPPRYIGHGGHDLRRHPHPLTSWFAAVWYVVNQKQGVSALGLQRVLDLGSYETAWAWLHKLRRAMVRPERGLLIGPVEVDETIIGGILARKVRPALGSADRSSAREAGSLVRRRLRGACVRGLAGRSRRR
jgi:hypothetical protein